MKKIVISIAVFVIALILLTGIIIAQTAPNDSISNIFNTIIGKTTPNENEIKELDMNKDGTVNILDAIAEQRKKNIYRDKNQPLRILTIGNSFSQDATEYMYSIAKDLGASEVIIGNAYIGGCTLEMHYNNSVSDDSAYDYYKSDASSGKMKVDSEKRNLQYMISDEDWDFISLQQGSPKSGVASSYQPYLSKLVDYIEKYKTNPDVKLVWHMTWAYQANYSSTAFRDSYNNDQMYMYQAIVDTVKQEVIPLQKFDMIVPSGTAIQNLRTGWLGDTLTRDGLHLSIPVGRYAAGAAYIGAVTGWNISELTYKPSDTDMSDELLLYIKDSVSDALNTKYSVTNSTHTEEPAPFDFENNYTLFDWEPVYGEFWQSTHTTHPTDRLNASNTSNTLYKSYVASGRMFTREELPLGTVIVIDSGYRYRADGWINLEKQNSRGDQIYQEYTVIDEAWWGDYNYRAFNISKSNGADISSEYAEAASHFRIYIPNSFENNYTLFDWEPVYGEFWQSTHSTHPTDRLNASNTTNTLYKSYVASGRMFTREDLPLGTVIVIDSGYRYRADGWINLEKQNSRGDQIYQEYTVIDEAWWGDYNYRAFNISKSNGADISSEYAEAASHFRIYIPNKNS